MPDIMTCDPSSFRQLQAHLADCWDFEAKPANPIEPGIDFIGRAMVKSIPALARVGLPSDQISTAIVQGNGSANGHGCLIGGKPVAWFAAEGYPTQARADVFVPHELIHAVHYFLSPNYAFDTKKGKDGLGRQLVTEGIATVLTCQAMNTSLEKALWADTQSIEATRKWTNTIAAALPDRVPSLLDGWNEDSGDLFLANDPSDPFRYRAGYVIGAWGIIHIMRRNSLLPHALLSLPRADLDALMKNALREFQTNPSSIPFISSMSFPLPRTQTQ